MHRSFPHTDWLFMMGRSARRPRSTDVAAGRLRRLLVGFCILLAVVFVRLVMLELCQGSTYREIARRPLERRQSLAGVRGRILARDGTVLAHDTTVVALTVEYRYLEHPPHARWLRSMARRRLPRAERRDEDRLAAAQRRVLSDRAELHRRLQQLSGLSVDEWTERTRRIQRRVERIAAGVNARQKPRPATASNRSASTGWWDNLRHTIADALRGGEDDAPAWITVAEELEYHAIVENLPLEMAAEIESNPAAYPGVRTVHGVRRAYPRGKLAAHTLGHLGAVAGEDSTESTPPHPDDRVGRAGVERQYEPQLRGRRGETIEWIDRVGRSLERVRHAPPTAGSDLVLSIDIALQQTAESLLDDAVARRSASSSEPNGPPAGGAIVVLDVHNGAVLASASAPRFDPNLFSGEEDQQLDVLLNQADRPLLDRATMMQIPPGSVFKTVSAIALLESGLVPRSPSESETPLDCRGFLNDPQRHRCLIFQRYGHGHGQITLADALARSCNVYFFHYAREMGPAPLIWWGRQTGFGNPTGIDLPGEAAGNLSPLDLLPGDSQQPVDALALAIGQGTLTATPLQVARLMAAVANGGKLVTPRVVSRVGLIEPAGASEDGDSRSSAIAPSRAIPDLSPATLHAIRRGLKRTVTHPDGTAHATVALADVSIAGKTGTAETGGGRADHAWFAGYVPAEEPRWAIVVALEHAGSGGSVAGPIASRLVRKIQSLGYLPSDSLAHTDPK